MGSSRAIAIAVSGLLALFVGLFPAGRGHSQETSSRDKCLKCHKKIARLLKEKHTHEPFTDHQCESCHRMEKHKEFVSSGPKLCMSTTRALRR